MTSWLSQHAAPLITVSALIFSTFVWVARSTARHRRLMLNLDLAAEMMDRHTRALDSFVADNRVPVYLREKLLGFSQSIFDQQIFLRALERACQLKPHEADATMRKERNLLTSIDPSLEATFMVAISSAIVGMVLKTQGATAKLDDALARLAVIEDEKSFIYMRVARKERTSAMPSGSALAGAA